MSDPIIQTRALGKRLAGRDVVQDLDLHVPSRAVYGFLGPNGAGKTTTIRLLLGLMRPTRGDIRILGRPLGRHRREVLGRTGALVETPSVYPNLTGRENLQVAATVRSLPRHRIDEVLDTVDLTASARVTVRRYSLGMRQRLGLALALLATPRLLILDEPTNGLDPQGIREIRELVRALPDRWDVTVFLSSHLLAEVEMTATHVGVIHQGRMLLQDSVADLRRRRADTALLTVDDPEAVAAELRAAGTDVRIDAHGLLEAATTGPAHLATLNRKVVQSGHRLYESRLRPQSLEELFLALTSPGAAR